MEELHTKEARLSVPVASRVEGWKPRTSSLGGRVQHLVTNKSLFRDPAKTASLLFCGS